jgi:general nucleoside transport system permease protein
VLDGAFVTECSDETRSAMSDEAAHSGPTWSRWKGNFGGPIAIIIGAFVVAGLFLPFFAINPFVVYREIILGALGSLNGFAETLLFMTPILLTALATILSFRCGMWNVGGDGQLYLGAIATVGLGFNALGLPGLLLLPLMAAGAFVAGAAWAAVPAFLRIYFKANEIIVTIMMNFLALIFAAYLISGPWASGVEPVSASIAPQGFLPILIPGTRLHANLLVALAAVAAVAFLLDRTVLGYRIRVIGQNPRAARVAGMPVQWVIFLSFALSGGVAGLAGFGEVAGIHHKLPDGLSPGYGFTGIAVALLANLNPLWSVVSALFLATLNIGADAMQRRVGVPVSFVWVIEGFILLALLSSGALRRS